MQVLIQQLIKSIPKPTGKKNTMIGKKKINKRTWWNCQRRYTTGSAQFNSFSLYLATAQVAYKSRIIKEYSGGRVMPPQLGGSGVHGGVNWLLCIGYKFYCFYSNLPSSWNFSTLPLQMRRSLGGCTGWTGATWAMLLCLGRVLYTVRFCVTKADQPARRVSSRFLLSFFCIILISVVVQSSPRLSMVSTFAICIRRSL